MIEPLLAGVVLALCAVLMLRLLLGQRRRQRFDAGLRRGWFAVRRRALAVWQWRDRRRAAERAAAEAIERARRAGEWDGNVYKPKSFRRPRKPH